MSLANMQGKLSRTEMKNVMGGNAQACSCKCSGGTGTWVYSYEPSRGTIDSDISKYCSSGSAGCTGCSHIMD